MLIEAFVFVGDKHIQIALIDLIRDQTQSPAPVLDGIGAQQYTCPITHLDRGLRQKPGQLGLRDPIVKGIAPQRRTKQRQNQSKWREPFHGLLAHNHLARLAAGTVLRAIHILDRGRRMVITPR